MDLDHEKRLTETESRSKSNTKRLDEMEKRQNDLADLVSTVKVLAEKEARVEKDVGDIKEAVEDIKSKPGKRWEGIVEKTITTLVGLLIGFLAAKIGLG